jgi:hypothetical protein
MLPSTGTLLSECSATGCRQNQAGHFAQIDGKPL